MLHPPWIIRYPLSKRDAPLTTYLTFDDGPRARWTPPLLDALQESDVRATFFVIDGQITADTEAVLRRTAAEGHTIGVHTGSRRLMFASPSRVARDVQRAANRIARITGRPPCALSGRMRAGGASPCTRGSTVRRHARGLELGHVRWEDINRDLRQPRNLSRLSHYGKP